MVQWSNHQIQTIGIHSTMGESIPIVFFFAILTYKKYDPGNWGWGWEDGQVTQVIHLKGLPGPPKMKRFNTKEQGSCKVVPHS